MTLAERQRYMAPALLAAGDGLCVLAAYLCSVALTAASVNAIPFRLVICAPYLLVFVVVGLGSAIDRRLWALNRGEGVVTYLASVTKAVSDATICCVFVVVLFLPEGIDRRFLVYFGFGTLFNLLCFRFLVHFITAKLRDMGVGRRRALIVGANERTAHLIEVLSSHPRLGYNLVGILEDDAERAKAFEDLEIPYLGPISELDEVLPKYFVDEVYISLPVRSYYSSIQEIAQYCEGANVTVHLLADLFPLRVATSRLMHIEDVPLLSLSTIPEAHFRIAIKHLFDWIASSIMILLLSPVFLVLAILIKLDSPGPLLFKQERVGQNQRRFKMIKFRTMVVNAEELKAQLMEKNEADGPVFKMKNDPRVTRIGRFLRKYSIDEFPQLFNVWMGEMSLVGPRPPIPSEVDEYTWSQRRRLSVRPGMTGLWQVSGRSDVGFKEWVQLDLKYIDEWSLLNDFIILLKTFKAVAIGRGAA